MDVVEAALVDAIAPFPEELRKALVAKFQGYYETPATASVEEVLRKRLTDDRARQLLFEPTPSDGLWYAALVQGPPHGAPATHPCAITCQRYLAMMYLCHAQVWSFASEFILHDGLVTLVSMFDHDDMHMRGQALDTFTQLTSNPAFDWFQQPTTALEKALHHKMLLLPNSASIVQQLVHNQATPELSFCALQILAFYMSWVRKLYTKGELRLSRALLDSLSAWTESASPDEAELAANVFADFNRWPAADASDSSSLAGVEYPREMKLLQEASDAFKTKAFDRVLELCSDVLDGNNNADTLPPAERQRALALRGAAHLAAGNAQAATGDLYTALEHPPTPSERGRWALSLADALTQLNQLDRALSVLHEHVDGSDGALHDAIQKLLAVKAAARASSKDAKEQALVEALMQRKHPKPVGPRDVVLAPVVPKRDVNGTFNKENNQDELIPAKPKVLLTKKKPTKHISTSMSAQPFSTTTGRRLLKAKTNPEAMAKLLSTLALEDFERVIGSVLSEDMLLGLFRGLRLVPASVAASIVGCLEATPRYQLTLDLASHDVLALRTQLMSLLH
ncbi:hypothetical protein SPRG_02268 [Saprolegnia parasitica CBS 223.65]|uniref:Uncharacterized protein n=1 Tax=Saprolegnia parasitica (strain CBS 223.65) TaxID=695850 RepID=A0A067D3Y0_SAPPC|nr:hypothetical protein SPRG_02268 [Saprolegnia parasitica CBS 223.65]KDO33461.1 hypothetical protein SPRG_02268 [Saprolegnia parasitica CBS 223.65]|eukprot:XP_012196206.1 hypothetical protein SPRG_02268 [Saprolegnia parasitica CBS 223.65]